MVYLLNYDSRNSFNHFVFRYIDMSLFALHIYQKGL